MSELEWQIEHARKKLAEFEATRATRDLTSDDSVFLRYGYLMSLLESLVKAYDAEHEKQVRERIRQEMPETCKSCTHLTAMHREDGCWFTVQVGRPGRDLVCPCAVVGAS